MLKVDGFACKLQRYFDKHINENDESIWASSICQIVYEKGRGSIHELTYEME